MIDATKLVDGWYWVHNSHIWLGMPLLCNKQKNRFDNDWSYCDFNRATDCMLIPQPAELAAMREKLNAYPRLVEMVVALAQLSWADNGDIVDEASEPLTELGECDE
jgi:hypothetical protein